MAKCFLNHCYVFRFQNMKISVGNRYDVLIFVILPYVTARMFLVML